MPPVSEGFLFLSLDKQDKDKLLTSGRTTGIGASGEIPVTFLPGNSGDIVSCLDAPS